MTIQADWDDNNSIPTMFSTLYKMMYFREFFMLKYFVVDDISETVESWLAWY